MNPVVSHMGVQTFATRRNSEVEFLVHFVLQKFCSRLESAGHLTVIDVVQQKQYSSEIASDVWDHFIRASQPGGRKLEVWCQTTCYKGNQTGKPEPNKTYEVRETLVEGLTIRQRFQEQQKKECRSIHFTVGDRNYTYQWFLELKAAVYDKSIYIGEPGYDIFADISTVLAGALTEQDKARALEICSESEEKLGVCIRQTLRDLERWWIDEGHPKCEISNKQWALVDAEFRAASTNWPDLETIKGQDIKGRTNAAVFGEETDTSDDLILRTAADLLVKNPFLSAAIQVLGNWENFCRELEKVLPAKSSLGSFLETLWKSPLPERLVVRRILLRIHTIDSVAYVQDRDVKGVTEHNIYGGDHHDEQTSEVCKQIVADLSSSGIRTPAELMARVRASGRSIVNQARWFEAKNGTQLKPSFHYAELALEHAGFSVSRPSAVGIRAIGYHAEISSQTVRPYTNLKAVFSPTGDLVCLLKAKFFRAPEFPRRCKEEAFVGLTLKYKYSTGVFTKRIGVPLVMYVDMASDYSPDSYSVKRLISFGWKVVFSSDELIAFLRTDVGGELD